MKYLKNAAALFFSVSFLAYMLMAWLVNEANPELWPIWGKKCYTGALLCSLFISAYEFFSLKKKPKP